MRSVFRFFCISLVFSFAMPFSNANAENIYDVGSGELFFPIIRLNDNTAVSGRFALTSQQPLIWSGLEFLPVIASSRSEATYNASDNTIFAPEINVQQSLFSLSFRVTQNCDSAVCLEPVSDSITANGREGSAVFTTALTPSSTFSCASCHALTENDGFAMDGLRRPGHTLLNAPQRESFKNGAIDNLLAAVNVCVTEWMNGDALASDDPDWVNLLNWLKDQNTVEIAEAVTIAIVPPPAELAGGNAENGRELFNTSCVVCHGFDGQGTQLAPQITNKGLTPELIASRVRTSGRSNSIAYEGLTGGVMPFWAADRLSDNELIDIVSFVSAGSQGEVIMGMDAPTVSADTGCTLSSPKIGQQAKLNGFFHDVAGTATIIDDCTIELTGFVFDGGGINVQFYLGQAAEFRESRGGFSASGNLVGIRYSGNTLRITLPAGRSLDDFNSISVWCVPVGVSFGTGLFS